MNSKADGADDLSTVRKIILSIFPEESYQSRLLVEIELRMILAGEGCWDCVTFVGWQQLEYNY